ncbi:DUF1614 domain-containing protein [Rhodopila globiformis]|uniref:DUF1614 domain-containing protein n=1 Tax=Rhodopila globiformis TaxID=1071 RepID=A0A2S6MZW7_RHOGL|nr:DUF1614 domain-containing protein [Rhodopila globiformis]PPQ27902.1 hypothetical protein CCS01_26210 [Rhodopila globiformis]
MSQLHYLPLPLPFFSILVGLFIFLIALVQVGVLRYAYMRLGLSARVATLVLLGSLIGSYFNVPLVELPQQQVLSGQVVQFYGMEYVVPVVQNWPGTVIAANLGGAIIPGLMSIYLLARHRLWVRGTLAIAGVAAVSHALAHPVPGVGIAVPIFVPAVATALVAMILSVRYAAPLAYIGGSVGTLVGADLLNLDKVQGLGAPVASIGGAGTFDGIFLTGVLAVLIAGLTAGSPDADRPAHR